jgi:hypothetical protein
MLPSHFTGKGHGMSTFTANYRLYDNGALSTKYISLAIWWFLILQEDILFTSLHFQKDATKLQAYNTANKTQGRINLTGNEKYTTL